MTDSMPDLSNPGRPAAMACLMAGVLLPALALFGVLIVSFIDRDVETVDGLSDGATLGIILGPSALLVAAAVLHVRGAMRRRALQADLDQGALLASWSYGDADLAVAHRVWETGRRRRGGRVFMMFWLPSLLLAGGGWTPLTLPMALVYGGVIGLTGIAWRGFHLYFLDWASSADARRVLIWSSGVWVRGSGMVFDADLKVEYGRWGKEALPVLSFITAGVHALAPVPRDLAPVAAEVATSFEAPSEPS